MTTKTNSRKPDPGKHSIERLLKKYVDNRFKPDPELQEISKLPAFWKMTRLAAKILRIEAKRHLQRVVSAISPCPSGTGRWPGGGPDV